MFKKFIAIIILSVCFGCTPNVSAKKEFKITYRYIHQHSNIYNYKIGYGIGPFFKRSFEFQSTELYTIGDIFTIKLIKKIRTQYRY